MAPYAPSLRYFFVPLVHRRDTRTREIRAQTSPLRRYFRSFELSLLRIYAQGDFTKTRNIHVSPVVSALLVEEGAVRIIARATKRTTSVDVVRLCASTLCNFAGEGRARPKMSDSRTAQVTRNMALPCACSWSTLMVRVCSLCSTMPLSGCPAFGACFPRLILPLVLESIARLSLLKILSRRVHTSIPVTTDVRISFAKAPHFHRHSCLEQHHLYSLLARLSFREYSTERDATPGHSALFFSCFLSGLGHRHC